MAECAAREASDKVVRFLRYEVREGREVGEVVVIPEAFIANRNQECILRLELLDFEGNGEVESDA